jgi:predicted ABC-type ATPase
MARPRMIVVAGPPGSGKTRYFPVTAFGVDAFNIDDRCEQILGSYRAIPRDVRRAVAKECERFVLDHISQRKSFAVETTLRTTAAIEQAELARRNGLATEMRFIATDSLAENIARVLQRAQAGGHGASEREIPGDPSRERGEPQVGGELLYHYDFGDDWEHRIVVESVIANGSDVVVCAGGARACPPEDCGGPPDYENLLLTLANRSDPEHASMKRWVGPRFDPERFESVALNKRLATLSRPLAVVDRRLTVSYRHPITIASSNGTHTSATP